MPNWCANRVTVFGDEADMREFKEFVKGKGDNDRLFSLNAILPMPEELRSVSSPVTIRTEEEIEAYKKEHSNSEWMIETLPITQEMSDRYEKKYGVNNWYDWANNNWGVKWDACDITAEEDFGDTEITYRFDTPWGPPQEIYTLLVAKFPNIHITWFWDEPGMELAGYLK